MEWIQSIERTPEEEQMGRVAGKFALVTGASQGLGEAISRRLAAEGARVAVTDLPAKADAGRRVAEETGGIFLPLDVTREADWSEALDQTVAAFGALDVLVNNAGIGVIGDIERTTLEDWRRTMAINADGVFLGCRLGIARIKPTSRERGGSIINISSVSGLVGGHNLAAYNASKGAVRLLSKSVALHCARQGYNIRCNSVHPAFIDTDMVQSMIRGSKDPERTRRSLDGAIPLGAIGRPNDVADLVLYLASEESRFVTGAEMVVDGGLTAGR